MYVRTFWAGELPLLLSGSQLTHHGCIGRRNLAVGEKEVKYMFSTIHFFGFDHFFVCLVRSSLGKYIFAVRYFSEYVHQMERENCRGLVYI